MNFRKYVNEERGKGIGNGGMRQRDGGTDICICPDCNKKFEHERGIPCKERTCPDCGVSLIGTSEKYKV